jgi:hypothetical protein
MTERHPSGESLERFLDRAPLDDEPSTPDEDDAGDIARQELERGETVSVEQARRELD